MTVIKICGIRELEHARVAADSGASLIGFVFVPVRREIKPDDAREIIATVRRQHEYPPATIGLFVNETADSINRTVANTGLDLVQLHGDEPPELAGKIDTPAIKALRLESGQSASGLRKLIESYLEHCVGILLDSHVPGHWGGTGVVGDWDIAAELASQYPIILAGGLAPENVAAAIETVRPAVVDVSSGVETDGRKDADKIRAFIDAAQNAAVGIDRSGASEPLVNVIEQARMTGSQPNTSPSRVSSVNN